MAVNCSTMSFLIFILIQNEFPLIDFLITKTPKMYDATRLRLGFKLSKIFSYIKIEVKRYEKFRSVFIIIIYLRLNELTFVSLLCRKIYKRFSILITKSLT
jgi:hypothetical protein